MMGGQMNKIIPFVVNDYFWFCLNCGKQNETIGFGEKIVNEKGQTIRATLAMPEAGSYSICTCGAIRSW